MNTFELIKTLQEDLEQINSNPGMGLDFKCAVVLTIRALKALRVFF